MRTPKIEAKDRAINWLNSYIIKNKNSKLPSTISILSKVHTIETCPLDTSPIDSNSWLSGFSDADANFSINIHKRSNKNSTRVQLYYRLEIRQNYNRPTTTLIKKVEMEPTQFIVSSNSNSKEVETLKHNKTVEGSAENIQTFFSVISKIGLYLGVTVYSRSRLIKDKIFHSFTIISQNKNSNYKIINYFNKYPLLSSKYLDFKDWTYVLALQNSNPITTSYLDKAIKIRTDFNSTRTTYKWDHLNDCYLNLKP
uniref:LAGLIDADG homing endonuclease n=1 Tax=Myochromella boudieri TaxID=117066 RepID=A0A386TY45_9AGAR|nr:LAGLIDADG homing endonuclease [Myochromella boudieri]AYE93145.1 LAGLIDADG homing endonuclease [Myochromella boudieri]